jgi:hypothetical protein
MAGGAFGPPDQTGDPQMFAINRSSCGDPCGVTNWRAAFDALGDAVDWAYGGVAIRRSRCPSGAVGGRLPADLAEALADPIVQALMTADGTDRDSVEAMMRGMAARLSQSGCRDLAAARKTARAELDDDDENLRTGGDDVRRDFSHQ